MNILPAKHLPLPGNCRLLATSWTQHSADLGLSLVRVKAFCIRKGLSMGWNSWENREKVTQWSQLPGSLPFWTFLYTKGTLCLPWAPHHVARLWVIHARVRALRRTSRALWTRCWIHSRSAAAFGYQTAQGRSGGLWSPMSWQGTGWRVPALSGLPGTPLMAASELHTRLWPGRPCILLSK